jgi:uncharacterized BrkB/YihY/UPF0761 family membrane protein
LLVVSVLGSFTANAPARQATLDFVLRYFPTRLEFVSNQIGALQRTQVPLGVMGGLALIWASLGFFSAISTAVNSAWRVERQRSYLKHKLVSFLMLAAADPSPRAIIGRRSRRAPTGRTPPLQEGLEPSTSSSSSSASNR